MSPTGATPQSSRQAAVRRAWVMAPVVLVAGLVSAAGPATAEPTFAPVACYDTVLRPASGCLFAAPSNGEPVATRHGRRVDVHTFVAVWKPARCPSRATVTVSSRHGDPRSTTTSRLRTVPVLLEGHARCRIDGHLSLRSTPPGGVELRVAITSPRLKPAQFMVHPARR